MAKTKFQVGDKVQFVKNNGDRGYLKGTKGQVYDIKTTVDGRALYKIVYKDVLTGELIMDTFRSSELEKVENKKKSEPLKFVDYTSQINSVKHYEDEIKPKKEQKENWDSWDDFCDKFKGELFK